MVKQFFSKIFATFFFIGYAPLMPGTVASVLTAYLWFSLPPVGFMIHLLIVGMLFMVGQITSSHFSQELGDRDPACIVIDEVFGMSIALLGVPHSRKAFILAFVLFRIFDIFKPFPINYLEDFADGWGIMLDDGAAGIAACLLAGFLGLFLIL